MMVAMMSSPVTPSAVSWMVTLSYSEALTVEVALIFASLSRMAFLRWSFATADMELVTTVLMARAVRAFGFEAYLVWA